MPTGGIEGFLEKVTFRQPKIGWVCKWEEVGGSDFWQRDQYV